MAQRINEIFAGKTAGSERPCVCEACGYRRPYENRRWCRACILAWQRERAERGISVAGGITDACRLESVIPERYALARMEHLPDAIREAAEGLPDERGLFLWGPPGVGKTYSLCAIAHRLYFSGWDVARTAYEMLALQIRDSYKPGATRTELDVLRPLIAVDKLILEDVGTTVGVGKVESDFSLRTFLVLLDTRLEHCRATYVSSNKRVEELGKSFDQRIASRLQQACEVIKLEGTDKRSIACGGRTPSKGYPERSGQGEIAAQGGYGAAVGCCEDSGNKGIDRQGI